VFGLESITDAEGNVIKEAPLPIWANFQQRALGVAIREVNAKTDLKIKLASIDRLKKRRVVALNFTIKTQGIPKGTCVGSPLETKLVSCSRRAASKDFEDDVCLIAMEVDHLMKG
jgi:hypothetical protein